MTFKLIWYQNLIVVPQFHGIMRLNPFAKFFNIANRKYLAGFDPSKFQELNTFDYTRTQALLTSLYLIYFILTFNFISFNRFFCQFIIFLIFFNLFFNNPYV